MGFFQKELKKEMGSLIRFARRRWAVFEGTLEGGRLFDKGR